MCCRVVKRVPRSFFMQQQEPLIVEENFASSLPHPSPLLAPPSLPPPKVYMQPSLSVFPR